MIKALPCYSVVTVGEDEVAGVKQGGVGDTAGGVGSPYGVAIIVRKDEYTVCYKL